MHSTSTRNEFLRLRVQGLSLATIGRRLHVSKPTLIAWNRKCQPELQAAALKNQQRLKDELTTAADNDLTALKRRHAALKQELLSRALREFSTSDIETLAGQLHQRIQHLESLTGAPPAQNNQPAPSSNGSVPAP